MGASLFVQQKWIAPTFTYKGNAILGTLLFFTITFEWVAPKFLKAYTQDYYDILAYASGALFFYLFQNYPVTNNKH
jgi:hypothetical protein